MPLHFKGLKVKNLLSRNEISVAAGSTSWFDNK